MLIRIGVLRLAVEVLDGEKGFEDEVSALDSDAFKAFVAHLRAADADKPEFSGGIGLSDLAHDSGDVDVAGGACGSHKECGLLHLY